MSDEAINIEDTDPYVGVDAVAEHFGVSVSAVRAWIRGKKLPADTYVKIGTTYRFKIGAMEAALFQQNRDEAADEDNGEGPIRLF